MGVGTLAGAFLYNHNRDVLLKRIVVVSDLHVGSLYGLLPPDYVTSEDIPKPQNPGQVYLWECWKDFCARAAEFKPDVIVVNGDALDGKQQAQRQTEISLPLIVDQQDASVVTLGLLPAVKKLYFLAGTPYHVGDGSEWEENVAAACGGERYAGAGTGKRVREVLDLEVEGVIFNFAHHISPASGFYRATASDREGQWSSMSAKDETKGIPKAAVLVRSHVHNFVHVEHASKHIVQTPCWQLQTRFMRRHSVYRCLPDIGGIFFEVNGRQKGYDDPVKLVKHLYSLPPAPVVKIT